MKKLVFMLATVACAAGLQAASFSWGTDGDSGKTARIYGVAASGVLDNGAYAKSDTLADRIDKQTYNLQCMLTILDASTGTEIGHSDWVTLGAGDKGAVSATGLNVAEAAQGTAYKYRIDITGTQQSLTGKGNAVDGGDGYDYDYTSAIITGYIEGDITTEVMGGTAIADNPPTSWTVSGITKTAQSSGGGDIPEPTSGLLLVLGGAMLALRRRR